MIVEEKTHKVCTKCKVNRKIEEYFRASKAKDGRCYCCKYCQKEKRKDYYRDNKDKILTRQNSYYYKNKERISGQIKEYRHKIKQESPESLFLHRAKQRAKKKNVPFSLTIEDIVIPEVCPILGIKLESKEKSGGDHASPSLDRLIPSLGYVKGNVWVICKLANSMKLNASPEQLVLFAEWVVGGMKIIQERKKI